MSKLFGFLIIGLMLQGCVKFEQQTTVYRHDTERDQLRMLVIYEGIFGRDEGDSDGLRSALLRPRAIILGGWFFQYDRDEWVRNLERLKYEKGTIPHEAFTAHRRLSELMLKNVQVANGNFYLNDEGKLSGYQQLTISDVSVLVAAFNEWMNVALRQGELDAADVSWGTSQWSQDLIRNAADSDHEWLVLYEGELRLRWPMARTDYEALSLELAGDPAWHAFTAGGLRGTYADGLFELAVGRPWPSRTSITAPGTEDPYVPNFMPFIEEQDLLESHPDFDAIVERFVDRGR